ncbi:MAG: hypothetical protein J2P16_05915 [Mycobacterium sp.]|nr:hypothetical protein [Mycobacterium sp.]
MIDATLTAAAFGDQPGRWPLPTANTPQQLWLRAVAAGGQGRYGSARADLARLLHSAPTTRLASLAHSTQGSFLRQVGWHTVARGWDGRALALAGDDPEAGADALLGLAADALGIGRLTASTALLRRADELVPRAPHRLSVRRGWIAAELAMACGDGEAAVRYAKAAVELAAAPAGPPSARHRAKSDMVLAAALCSAGALEEARAVGDAALDLTGRLGLVPLRWALACLLIDLESRTRTPQELRDIRDACAQRVRHAGGAWNVC